MRRILNTLITLLVAGCAHTQTIQQRENTSDGVLTRTISRGPTGESVVEEWDSAQQYQDCMSNINRRQMNGMTAEQYCGMKTRSTKRKNEDAQNGGTPSPFGGMYGGAWGGGYGSIAPPMQNWYAGSGLDPAQGYYAPPATVYMTPAQQSKSSGIDPAVAKQLLANAREQAKLRRELDALKQRKGSTPPAPKHADPPPPSEPADATQVGGQ